MRIKIADVVCALICVPCLATQAFAGEDEGAKTQSSSPDTFRVAQANPVPATTERGSSSELEEVTITAERRKSDLQATAVSVSVRSGNELTEQGRYTTRQILEDIPGVVAVDNSSLNIGSADVQGNNITIRGVSSGTDRGVGGPSGISAAPGTAVYVDGVYEGIGSGYDIDRVEVLRGPQGTLYGRSATTGVVAFHTRDPSFDSYGGNAEVEAGNYDLQHYSAAVNLPVNSTFALRLAGNYHNQGDGYYGIAAGTSGGGGMAKTTDGRAKALWAPNDAFSLLVGFAYEKNEAFSGGNSYLAAVPGLALTTLNPGLSPGLKEQREYWAEANWDVGPVKITYLPAFRDWYQNDHLLVSANFLESGVGLGQALLSPTDNFQTQELRVASKDDAAVQWQAGTFYYRNTLTKYNFDALDDGTILSTTDDAKDTRNVGVFAETTIPVTASTRVTLGVRYDDTKVVVSESYYDDVYALCGTFLQPLAPLPPGATCTGVSTASVPSPPAATLNGVVLRFHNFNYKARLEQDLTQKNMVYGMISTGFRPGDEGITSGKANFLSAEKLTSLEAGSKNRFLDDSLQINADVYYYNYRGFQTSYVPTPFAINNSIAVTVPAYYIGGELEALYRLTAHDRFGLNYDHVESRWYDKPAGFAAAQPEGVRALVPNTVTANYEHVFNLPGGSTFMAHIDGEYQAAHLTANLHTDYLALGFKQYVFVDGRTIGNLSANWTSSGGRYAVSAYMRNFTNRQYINYAVNGLPNQLNVSWTDPRIYGVLASVHF
jgi:iron complex outermembrane receptor protein